MSINLIEVAIDVRQSSKPSPKLIVLEGEPGVGKSRFLRAIMDVALKNSMRYDKRFDYFQMPVVESFCGDFAGHTHICPLMFSLALH